MFLHPFDDGNGRIHRFLIHNILSLQGLVPRGLMFTVSAVMLKNPGAYGASLETFSRPLLQLIDYRLDEMGQMVVENDTACWYQYIDMPDRLIDLFIQMWLHFSRQGFSGYCHDAFMLISLTIEILFQEFI